MIRLTGEMLREICPQATNKACELFAPYINEGVKKYGIYDKEVFSAFLAHIVHESGVFKYVREIWGNTSWQVRYERDFKEAWTENLKPKDRNYTAYNLGNNEIGDGKRFMGRGLLQITGKSNYRACSIGIWGDLRLLESPSILEAPEYAVSSAFWYCFDFRKLTREFKTLNMKDDTKKINGIAMLGLSERINIRNNALKVL